MKPISTSTYTFEDLIGGGYVYVDKTADIHVLASQAKGQYVIARPRRFGKSLLISTLQCLFEGRRELFRGLAIDSMPWDWTPIPVLKLDMGSSQARDGDELRVRLSEMMDAAARAENLSFPGDLSPAGKFLFLVEALAAKSPTGRIAILVDEYDKPLLGLLGKPEVSGVRDALKAFRDFVEAERAKDAGDAWAAWESNTRVHMRLLGFGGNRYGAEMLSRSMAILKRAYAQMYAGAPENAGKGVFSDEVHLQLADALLAGDFEGAVSRLNEDIFSFGRPNFSL